VFSDTVPGCISSAGFFALCRVSWVWGSIPSTVIFCSRGGGVLSSFFPVYGKGLVFIVFADMGTAI
jgi:hypothetical protein